ncbi:AMSH-like ubiquitin thioesterase 2 isoform X4 [Vigna angularis]|uniref:AMSH-like ubiquitin thioesterase 2 isoform X4 n=1 Tax=Phaseolus angularis TaxID=3914 RepID=UPI0022B41138|nr:AMSH-like ubiquitin thioesterase 2 isoform X4 [Vigna angularis]
MYKQSNEEQGVSNRKVRNCDAAESSFQSMNVDDVDPSGCSSFQLRNLSCCSLVCKPSAPKTANRHFMLHKVTQSWPSPALSFVERVPQDAQSSHVTVFNSGDGSSKTDNESTSSKSMRDVHISMRLMEDFLDLAKENTEKDLETCGILGAYLEKGTLYMTTLIIPKQESASNSMMIPEAFAIVLAPNDKLRSCGLFRIADPEGMNILKNCQETGFHPHKEPDNGNPVYEHCSNVYRNSNLRFEIFDLRLN